MLSKCLSDRSGVKCKDAYSESKYEGYFDLGGFMIQLIVNAFVEKDNTGAVVEVLYASSDHEKVKAKYEELVAQYPENYLAIYDVPLDTDLNTLNHYPSVWIGKEEFE